MPFQFPYEFGTSRQGAPVRVRHNTPLIIWRWSPHRPPRRGARSGNNGSNRAHSASVKSCRSCTGDAYRTRAPRSGSHALVACAEDTARHNRMLDLTGGDAAALTETRTALERIANQD